MKVLIGLPIYKRAWCLPTWLKAIEDQTFPLKDLGFIFELGPDDDETHDILWSWHMNHPQVSVFDGVVRADANHKIHEDGQRTWQLHDYTRMVELRNNLLDRVIAIQPEAFFSLDSDIILEDSKTIEALYELVQNHDAVGTLSYMWPTDREFPSVMTWVNEVGGPANRVHSKYEIGSLFKADIIMAAVMMSPEVYNKTRYRFHRLGEDLGFAADATYNGFELYCASYLYTPHILHPHMLAPYLESGDPRNPFINL